MKVGEAIADLALATATRYSLLVTIAPVRSAWPDGSQSDCEHREDYKDCTSIAHGRTRSAPKLIFSAYNYEVDRTMIL
jgi:hypothetical protein